MNLLKNKKMFSGGALILQMFLAVCFMVWLFPVNAFAAVEVDWSTIRSTVDGACHNVASDTSGEGWSYSHATNTVTILEGTIVNGRVEKNTGASGPSEIDNIHSVGGIFTDIILSGNFTGTVINKGTISGGTFNGAVTNNGTIYDGEFEGEVINEGTINGGTFNDEIINYSGGTIDTDNITLRGSIVDGSASGNTPNPNPGDNNSNSENTTSDNNEYVFEFVEPVVIVVPEGQKYVDDVMEQLATVPTDGKVVIDTKDWYCFNRTLAEKVTSMKDITVTIKYKYQGKRYEVTIPAGSDVVSLLGETGFVGFRYLDLVFGGREITE